MTEIEAKRIVQVVVYRRIGDTAEILVLKRNRVRGGFWSLVNGTVELGETDAECRGRELREETGVKEVMYWTSQLHSFVFLNSNSTCTVVVFGAEISHDAEIVINEEHSEFLWLDFDRAVARVKFVEDANSVLRLKAALLAGGGLGG